MEQVTDLKAFQRSWEAEAKAPGLDCCVHGDHHIGFHASAPGISSSTNRKTHAMEKAYIEPKHIGFVKWLPTDSALRNYQRIEELSK